MHIQLITNYWHFPSEKYSTRYGALAGMLHAAGHRVEVITSSFRHATKSRRRDAIADEVPYEVKMLSEPQYKRNISLNRIYSHQRFANLARRHIEKLAPADVIYCAVPPFALGNQIGKSANSRGIPFVLDVQDLWPEAFAMAIGTSLPARKAISALSIRANAMYSRADALIAVSNTYRVRATVAEGILSKTIYIGIDLEQFDSTQGESAIAKRPGELWVTYAGALGHSYDIPLLLEACRLAKYERAQHVRVIILGDGHRRPELQSLARALGVDALFMGHVPYDEMVRILRASDVAVNPIVPASVATIINKHGDYLASGIPMLNNQVSPELRDLLDDWKAGLNCRPGSARDMATNLTRLLDNSSLRKTLGQGARKLAEEKFDRNRTYPQIIETIECVRAR
ncbi:glycosyltransferase family 4 protein [Serinicoccus sp. LYQ131]|uniref:glycosyltransferase family 4 protein n=1 Tax=Serinicoccus sp. LYQ131 TaxID=3378797 RepID=UPI0038522C68